MADRRHKKFKTEFIAKEKIESFKNTILNNKIRFPSSMSDNINDITANNKVNFKRVIFELEDILTSSQVNKEEINRSKDFSNLSKNSSMINSINNEKNKYKSNNYLPSIELNKKLHNVNKTKNSESEYRYSSFYRRDKNKNIQYENNISENKFKKLIKEDIINVKSKRLKSLNNSKVNITEEFNLKEEIFLMKNGIEKPGNILKTGKSVSTMNPRYIKTKIVTKKLLFNKIMHESTNIFMYK